MGLPARDTTAANDSAGPDALLLSRLTRAPLLLGYAISLLCFGGLGLWSVTANIASAVVASGVVSPEGNRKVIQHFEGGIIAEILVDEGDEVAAGDPLLVLRETRARASVEVLRGQEWLLAATVARLEAAQANAPLVFPSWMTDRAAASGQLNDILTAQRDLFDSREALYASRKAIGEKRVAQLEQEIAGLEAQISSQRRQLELIAEERVAKKKMLDGGLFPLPEYLALLRLEAEVQGEMAQNEAMIARAGQSIGETRLQIVSVESERLDAINDELSEARTDLDSVKERLVAGEDALTRTVIAAPVAGVVVNKRFYTTGGVVGPGEAIMDIVPSGEKLLIDARLSPLDVDEVYAQQQARVVFSAFAARNLPQIHGTLQSISADSLLDEMTGLKYYRARVEVTEDELARLGPDIKLSSGMPVELYIVTGERTLMQYLLKPLTDSLRRSFRET